MLWKFGCIVEGQPQPKYENSGQGGVSESEIDAMFSGSASVSLGALANLVSQLKQRAPDNE